MLKSITTVFGFTSGQLCKAHRTDLGASLVNADEINQREKHKLSGQDRNNTDRER